LRWEKDAFNFFSFFTFIVSAPGHELDVPKQITLSDHCFGFKLMHNFHRPDALPAVKLSISSRLGEITLLQGSHSCSAADLVKIQKPLL